MAEFGVIEYLQVHVTFSLQVRFVMEESWGVAGAEFVCRLYNTELQMEKHVAIDVWKCVSLSSAFHK